MKSQKTHNNIFGGFFPVLWTPWCICLAGNMLHKSPPLASRKANLRVLFTCKKIIIVEEIVFPPGLSGRCFSCLGQKSVTSGLLSTESSFLVWMVQSHLQKRKHVPPFMCCPPFSRVLTDPLVHAGPPPFDTLDSPNTQTSLISGGREPQSSSIELLDLSAFPGLIFLQVALVRDWQCWGGVNSSPASGAYL